MFNHKPLPIQVKYKCNGKLEKSMNLTNETTNKDQDNLIEWSDVYSNRAVKITLIEHS